MKMSKRRKEIKSALVIVEREIWQDRPYTAVKIQARYDGGEYTAVGFSKVCWPDWWNYKDGEMIAEGRALDKIARNIEEIYSAAGWPTKMTSVPFDKEGWIGNTEEYEKKTTVSA